MLFLKKIDLRGINFRKFKLLIIIAIIAAGVLITWLVAAPKFRQKAVRKGAVPTEEAEKQAAEEVLSVKAYKV